MKSTWKGKIASLIYDGGLGNKLKLKFVKVLTDDFEEFFVIFVFRNLTSAEFDVGSIYLELIGYTDTKN